MSSETIGVQFMVQLDVLQIYYEYSEFHEMFCADYIHEEAGYIKGIYNHIAVKLVL